jgi:hypothetical protein
MMSRLSLIKSATLPTLTFRMKVMDDNSIEESAVRGIRLQKWGASRTTRYCIVFFLSVFIVPI